jgi:hypothetical protein
MKDQTQKVKSFFKRLTSKTIRFNAIMKEVINLIIIIISIVTYSKKGHNTIILGFSITFATLKFLLVILYFLHFVYQFFSGSPFFSLKGALIFNWLEIVIVDTTQSLTMILILITSKKRDINLWISSVAQILVFFVKVVSQGINTLRS